MAGHRGHAPLAALGYDPPGHLRVVVALEVVVVKVLVVAAGGRHRCVWRRVPVAWGRGWRPGGRPRLTRGLGELALLEGLDALARDQDAATDLESTQFAGTDQSLDDGQGSPQAWLRSSAE